MLGWLRLLCVSAAAGTLADDGVGVRAQHLHGHRTVGALVNAVINGRHRAAAQPLDQEMGQPAGRARAAAGELRTAGWNCHFAGGLALVFR